jgi:hypothetical protein
VTGFEAEHPLAFDVIVNITWSYTSTAQEIFITCSLMKHRDNLIFVVKIWI